MAKKQTKTKFEEESEKAAKAIPEGYELVDHVRVPTRRIPDNQEFIFEAAGEVATKTTKDRDKSTGELVEKEIAILRCKDPEHGEQYDIVCGSALADALIQAAKKAPLEGRTFLIKKFPPAPGKRFKDYIVQELRKKSK